VSNCRERIDDDIDYLYERAEKIGKRPTELQEEQFCDRVFDLIKIKEINDFDARRLAFVELFGQD
jgi:hypothetical protein